MFTHVSQVLRNVYAGMDLSRSADQADCDLETAPFDDELFTVIDGAPVTFREFNARLRAEMSERDPAPARSHFPQSVRKAV